MIPQRAVRNFVRADPDEVLSIGQKTVVLMGPPDALTGEVVLHNRTDDPVAIREVAVKTGKKSAGLLGDRLRMRSRFEPGGQRTVPVSVALPADVAPGEYEERIRIGGKEVPVRLVVQPLRRVDVNPRRLHFVGIGPGLEHRAELTISNRGNVPVQVPNMRHATALDVDTLCKSMVLAIREHGDEGSTATLDAFVRGIRKDMAGWFELTLEEAGEVVEPGTSLEIHLTMKLPDDVETNRTYDGTFRLLGRTVSYVVAPAPIVRTQARAARRKAAKKAGERKQSPRRS